MDGDIEILERGRTLSECLIWPLIESFYGQSGPDAWKETPYYPTSNPYIADAHAELAVAYLRDVMGRIDPEKPVYIVELAAGMGAFGLFFLKALHEKVAHFAALRRLDLRYVMTDFTEKNLARWEQDEQLRAFADEGRLDFALFWPERDSRIVLRRSGVVLKAGTLANPLLVIANYFFDSIRHDFFQTEHGTLREVRPTVYRRRADGPPRADQVRMEETFRDVSSAYYPAAGWNALLEAYRQELPAASFLFPVGALRTIDNLTALSGELLLLASDKGFHGVEYLDGHYAIPYVPHTGSFSFSVNFHALARYVRGLGGRSWRAHENPALTTFAAALGDGPLENVDYAASRFLLGLDPAKNAFALAELVTGFAPRESVDAASRLRIAMACVQLSGFDPWTFQGCGEYLQEGLATVEPGMREELIALLERVEENGSPLALGWESALGWLRYLYFQLGAHARCGAVNERLLAHHGPHRDYFFYRAVLHEAHGRGAAALADFRRALELDPQCALCRDGIARLEARGLR